VSVAADNRVWKPPLSPQGRVMIAQDEGRRDRSPGWPARNRTKVPRGLSHLCEQGRIWRARGTRDLRLASLPSIPLRSMLGCHHTPFGLRKRFIILDRDAEIFGPELLTTDLSVPPCLYGCTGSGNPAYARTAVGDELLVPAAGALATSLASPFTFWPALRISIPPLK
jgi:hypothetical protein